MRTHRPTINEPMLGALPPTTNPFGPLVLKPPKSSSGQQPTQSEPAVSIEHCSSSSIDSYRRLLEAHQAQINAQTGLSISDANRLVREMLTLAKAPLVSSFQDLLTESPQGYNDKLTRFRQAISEHEQFLAKLACEPQFQLIVSSGLYSQPTWSSQQPPGPITPEILSQHLATQRTDILKDLFEFAVDLVSAFPEGTRTDLRMLHKDVSALFDASKCHHACRYHIGQYMHLMFLYTAACHIQAGTPPSAVDEYSVVYGRHAREASSLASTALEAETQLCSLGGTQFLVSLPNTFFYEHRQQVLKSAIELCGSHKGRTTCNTCASILEGVDLGSRPTLLNLLNRHPDAITLFTRMRSVGLKPPQFAEFMLLHGEKDSCVTGEVLPIASALLTISDKPSQKEAVRVILTDARDLIGTELQDAFLEVAASHPLAHVLIREAVSALQNQEINRPFCLLLLGKMKVPSSDVKEWRQKLGEHTEAELAVVMESAQAAPEGQGDVLAFDVLRQLLFSPRISDSQAPTRLRTSSISTFSKRFEALLAKVTDQEGEPRLRTLVTEAKAFLGTSSESLLLQALEIGGLSALERFCQHVGQYHESPHFQVLLKDSELFSIYLDRLSQDADTCSAGLATLIQSKPTNSHIALREWLLVDDSSTTQTAKTMSTAEQGAKAGVSNQWVLTSKPSRILIWSPRLDTQARQAVIDSRPDLRVQFLEPHQNRNFSKQLGPCDVLVFTTRSVAHDQYQQMRDACISRGATFKLVDFEGKAPLIQLLSSITWPSD